MKTRSFASALAVLAAVTAPAGAQQRLLPAQSEIAFTSKQMGVPVDGRFRSFDAQIAFDPKKPDASKIAITIALASASLGSAETDAELVKPEWFAALRFPQATFQSSAVKAVGPGRFEVTGQLAIKGTSQEVVVPVALTQAVAGTIASGMFVIRRLDFHIGDGDWKDTSLVANDVLVRFKLTLTGVGAL